MIPALDVRWEGIDRTRGKKDFHSREVLRLLDNIVNLPAHPASEYRKRVRIRVLAQKCKDFRPRLWQGIIALATQRKNIIAEQIC